MVEAMKSFVIQKLLFPIVRLYWRVFRPKTYGVKGLVIRATDESVLLVRHAYGNTAIWNIPGGGFKPRRESADRAVVREIHEELGLQVVAPTELGEYRTEAQGKRDTVTIFSCRVEDAHLSLNDEIAEARWFSPDELATLDHPYAITRRSFELYRATELKCV